MTIVKYQVRQEKEQTYERIGEEPTQPARELVPVPVQPEQRTEELGAVQSWRGASS